MENNNTTQKVSLPMAIIIAGFLIMVGILVSGGSSKQTEPKTLSEQIGIKKETMASCLKEIDTNAFGEKITISVTNAMKGVPENERGTPYSVVIGKNGAKSEIRGNLPYESVKKIIEEVKTGKVSKEYKGEIASVDESDHIFGNKNTEITIIEYSDFECPYCKLYGETIKKIVEESDGKINWVFRHWPIHQNSFSKTIASECVAKIKGNDAFWKYSELLFSLIKTSNEPEVAL